MKLRSLIFTILPALALTACSDYADQADRLIPVDNDKLERNRNVLMIEFTGQMCVNCPTAHERIESYEKTFGENFIVVSIHGGTPQMGIDQGPMALGTPTGVEYNNLFGIESWPSAVIDWNSGNLGSNYGKWLTTLVNRLAIPAEVDIDAKATFDGSEITVTADMRSTQGTANANFLVWLTESDIVKFQLIPPSGTPNMNYVHNNVFRATLCGLRGDAVTVTSDHALTETRAIATKSDWVPANMDAVVFVYTEGKGVMGVTKVKVETPAQN